MRHIFILVALLCASCGTQLPSIKPYKLDIQQGNVVTSKMLLQLRPGMTKSQVRFIMGTPLIQDSFHGNRWDYVYQMRENGKIKEQRRVILDFQNELLKSVRGDVVPAGSEQAKETEAAVQTGTRVVPPVKAEKEKSLLDRLKFWGDDEPAADAATAGKQEPKQNVEQAPSALVVPASEANPPANNATASEPTSILAVPVLPDAAPSEAVAPAAVPVAVEPPPAPVAPVKETGAAQAETTPAVVAPKAVEPATPAPAVIETQPAVMAEPVPASPENPNHYQSPAGMQFDRRLQIEEEAPVPPVEPSGSRTGNKVAPTPKPLPAETEPSFFDRMLEQIGF